MFNSEKNLINDESGFGTIEVIILLAILVGIALLFKTEITSFVQRILKSIVNKDFSI